MRKVCPSLHPPAGPCRCRVPWKPLHPILHVALETSPAQSTASNPAQASPEATAPLCSLPSSIQPPSQAQAVLPQPFPEATATCACVWGLQSAADRGRLGGSTFKNLNLGVASFGAAALTATLYVYQFSKQLAWSKPLLVRTVILGLAALTCLAG